MFYNLKESLEKPALYTKSKEAFWDDEYISKQMLKAHLDPDFSGASRKFSFIEQSVSWIKEKIPAQTYPKLLDIGCGPGIYAEKFALENYQVTGVDFSKLSIDYAKKSAQQHGLANIYYYQDYLAMDLKQSFDLATLIYCDYGALSTKDRQTLLDNIYQHLKPGGKLLLDVFSQKFYQQFQEEQKWENCENGGFWRPDEYIALYGNYKYSNDVTLEQTTIVSDTEITPYYVWNTCFTKDALIKEMQEAGFEFCEIFSDVTGRAYNEENETMAIIVEKNLGGQVYEKVGYLVNKCRGY